MRTIHRLLMLAILICLFGMLVFGMAGSWARFDAWLRVALVCSVPTNALSFLRSERTR